ncbi:hypothetical protein GGI07_005876, partial [Coemansia sp. Benny D115]
MVNYTTTVNRSVSGIINFIYTTDEEVSYEEFYNVFQQKLKEVRRMTGAYITNFNFAFIDQNSNLHYYAVTDDQDIGELIVRQNLDVVFGGSDNQPEGYEVILSTKMFKINALDNSGGDREFKSDYYICIGIEDNEHNCLIECFKFFSGSVENSNEIRKKLGFKPMSMLGLKHIPVLEQYFETEVCVKLDEIDINYEGQAVVVTPRISYGQIECKSVILYKDNHFNVVIEEDAEKIMRVVNSKKQTEIKKGNDVLYYFFDYETIWDPDTLKLEPYSFAIMKTDNIGVVIDEMFEIGNMDRIINYLLRESINNKDNTKILVGYNNSRFDNFLLLKEIMKCYWDRIDRVFFVSNTILSMNVFDFQVMDLCRVINMSLANACQAFKCRQQKLSLDHNIIQSMYMQGELENYITHNHDKIKEYNLMDVRTLTE